MRVKFAGGVGEHGRSCFLVEGETLSFLVDCGLMAGAERPWPHLTAAEIRNLACLFLTHSHADHTGALPWLEGQGFAGVVVAAPETLEQLKTPPRQGVSLGEFAPPAGLVVRWGRSGHCAGSLWYQFRLEGRTLLFSGDYTECSLAYAVDPIREVAADLAVLDSAYGPEPRSAGEMARDLLAAAGEMLSRRGSLLLPVPKYGRGLELALLLHRAWPALPIYGDGHFLGQLAWAVHDRLWTREELRLGLSGVSPLPLTDQPPAAGLCFVSDPQLRTPALEALARHFAGAVLLTGTVEAGTGSARLQKEGLAVFCRLPVHCTDQEREALERVNAFGRVVPYHTPSHPLGKMAGAGEDPADRRNMVLRDDGPKWAHAPEW